MTPFFPHKLLNIGSKANIQAALNPSFCKFIAAFTRLNFSVFLVTGSF